MRHFYYKISKRAVGRLKRYLMIIAVRVHIKQGGEAPLTYLHEQLSYALEHSLGFAISKSDIDKYFASKLTLKNKLATYRHLKELVQEYLVAQEIIPEDSVMFD